MVETTEEIIKSLQEEAATVKPLDSESWSVTDDILEALNDYLIEKWQDIKLFKKGSTETSYKLMNKARDAVCNRLKYGRTKTNSSIVEEYETKKEVVYNRLRKKMVSEDLIRKTTMYLAESNRLIGINPDEV